MRRKYQLSGLLLEALFCFLLSACPLPLLCDSCAPASQFILISFHTPEIWPTGLGSTDTVPGVVLGDRQTPKGQLGPLGDMLSWGE